MTSTSAARPATPETASRPPRLLLLAGAMSAAVALVPMVYLVIRACDAGWHRFAAVLLRPRTLETVATSLALSITVVLGCLAVGVPAAWLVARARLPLGRLWFVLLALPLAMYCASYASDHPEHSFLAGGCLQRLGQPASAAHFYRVALQLNEADAASAYRLGECLEAVGQLAEASHLFHWAVELARGNFALRSLQDMASAQLAKLVATR